MNNIFKYWLLIIVVFLSCQKKDSLPEDPGCVNVVQSSMGKVLLNQSAIDSIHVLFQKHQISSEGLQFFRLQHNTKLHEDYVYAYMYLNKLKVFDCVASYAFGPDGILFFKENRFPSTVVSGYTPLLDPSNVRAYYVNEFDKDTFYHGILAKEDVDKGCVDVEYGYYMLDLNTGESIPAWRVTPHNSDYPVAYIDDVNPRLLYYSNVIPIN